MKNLSKSRRNEIAFLMVKTQLAGDGIHFPKQNPKTKKVLRKNGIKTRELVAFTRDMAGMLAKETFGKKK